MYAYLYGSNKRYLVVCRLWDLGHFVPCDLCKYDMLMTQLCPYLANTYTVDTPFIYAVLMSQRETYGRETAD